jgi:hypothetical protein
MSPATNAEDRYMGGRSTNTLIPLPTCHITQKTVFSSVFPEFQGAEVHGSRFSSVFHLFFICFSFVFHLFFICFSFRFSSVFATKIFELAVKQAEKQTEKQPKNVTMSIPIKMLGNVGFLI